MVTNDDAIPVVGAKYLTFYLLLKLSDKHKLSLAVCIVTLT